METPDSTHTESTPPVTHDGPAIRPPTLALLRDARTIQTVVVGSVLLALAGIAFLLTVGFIAALWLPAWTIALALTIALTAAALAVFSSLRSAPAVAPAMEANDESTLRETDAIDVAAIEEIDAEELEPRTQRAPASEPPKESARASAVSRSTRASAPFHPATQLG